MHQVACHLVTVFDKHQQRLLYGAGIYLRSWAAGSEATALA
jgi:hypothetical protein